MTVRRSESERHAIAHTEWAVNHATPGNPDVCFDYELAQTLLSIIKRTADETKRLRAALRVLLALHKEPVVSDEKWDDAIDAARRALEQH